MLNKLLKYELKATARIFLPLYGLLLVFAAVSRVFTEINSKYLSIPQGLVSAAYGFLMVGIFVMTIIVTIQRFYKNLLGDEGYLMLTLPVSTGRHIWAKAIVSFLWSMLSVLVAFLSVIVMFAKQSFFGEFGHFWNDLMRAMGEYSPNSWLFLAELILMVLIGGAMMVFQVYFAMVLGNRFSKHKLLASVGCYVGLNLAEQLVVSLVFSIFGEQFVNFVDRIASNGAFHVDAAAAIQLGHIVFISILVFLLVFAVLFFILTNWLLKKKPNLE